MNGKNERDFYQLIHRLKKVETAESHILEDKKILKITQYISEAICAFI